MVVDDDRLLLGLFIEGLERHDMNVTGCSDTGEARQRLAQSPCDLLISDQVMARPDEGIDFLEEALSAGWCRAALLISGYPRERKLDERVHPDIRFLRKPFRLPVLIDTCHELLAESN